MVSQVSPKNFSVFFTADGQSLSCDNSASSPTERCKYLEQGGIIFFPVSPIILAGDERNFLLHQKQREAANHKNIAYKPTGDRIAGANSMDAATREKLHSIMRNFSGRIQDFLREFLAPYAQGWQLDYASFRPVEEKGRKMRLRARNDLLHVDSFPTRPVFGNRILRMFHNLNPEVSRVWYTADPFEKLAATFKERMVPTKQGLSPSALGAVPGVKAIASMLGITMSDSSPYDRWMMNFHNFLKENTQFQSSTRKNRWEFPPGSAWIVFTDGVSHAAMSGQYALEQTFIISKDDMVTPELAPINVLDRMYPASAIGTATNRARTQELVGASTR
jgi:hypothetical protein